MTARIKVDQEAIADFCRQNHIRKLSLFGSVVRDDFTPQSDVDILVEFEPGKTPGWEFFGLAQQLEEILGRRVDLHTEDGIGSRIRGEVLREAQSVYVAA